MKTAKYALAVALGVVALVAGPAYADTISGSITITDPDQTTIPGGTLTYHGFFTNTGDVSEELLGGVASVGCVPGGCPTFDFSAIQGLFGTILTPGESTVSQVLFGLTVPSDFTGVTLPDTIPGSFAGGCFFPVGGNSGICPGAAFTATVAPVPEPSSLLLLGTGLVGLAGAMRRKRLA